MEDRVVRRFAEIKKQLAACAPRPVVVAVSKKQSVAAIRALYRAGCRDFGENYVQEWMTKRTALLAECPEIRWHFIGAIQSNKLPAIVGEAVLVHSLDSERHMEKIQSIADKKGIVQQCLLQVNLSKEKTKGGIFPEMCAAFLQAARRYPRVKITGLMTFPETTEHAESNRAIFRSLRELGRQHALTEFSMGTSDDWKVAVEEGASLLRLGTTLFGTRK